MGNVKPWRGRERGSVTRREALQTMGACQPQPLGDTRVKLNPRTLLPLAPTHIRPVAEALLNEAEEAGKRLTTAEGHIKELGHYVAKVHPMVEEQTFRLSALALAVSELGDVCRRQVDRIKQLEDALAPSAGKAVH